jgi:N-methylhydantoinase A
VNLRVSGIGPITRPEIRKHSSVDGFETGAGAPSSTTGDAPSSSRAVCFDAAEGYVDTPVLWRPDLAPGAEVEGPVIIEEFGSTVPVHPGFTARVDDYLNIIVTRTTTGRSEQ